MTHNDIIFTSHCFDNAASGGDYRAQQVRLEKTIRNIYPDAPLHFIYESEAIGKPKFQKSLYGFKVHLVKDCLEKGFKKIIFFDTAICLNDTVDYWFNLTKDFGILAPIDSSKLEGCTSNNCLKYLGLTREDITGINLVGGSIYIFDFNTKVCNDIFNVWADLEANGLFGQQEDISNGRLEGHRMDETCMAIAMAKHGVKPLGHDIIRYAYEKPGEEKLHTMGDGNYKPIVIKRHFK